jgi:hypothetical protein
MTRCGHGENDLRLTATPTVRVVSCDRVSQIDFQAGPSCLRVFDTPNDVPELQLTRALFSIHEYMEEGTFKVNTTLAFSSIMCEKEA